ncbi:mitochondrial thiamine pyrophosphate transporter [Stylosanthes scabra]|uniref:Mitochondrial thiamine pyrophosphate transporter n=1 Tax=Stylosanthes scabra TaxID=79078 RepID=A0ABU6SST8_9FABA|nr:mitochondrial thiamine pyrophosphate transporter [Stylosanthes scabra]
MEPLLRGEGSGGRRELARGIFRRSDAITYGSNYEKAAALVDLAEDGVGLPEQILDSSSFQSSSRYYFIFIKFNILWSLAYFALIVLNFLEKPLWCENYTTPSCSDREYFFLGQLPYLTDAECLIYEGLAIVVLIIHTFFPISYEGPRIYWRNPINLLKALGLLFLLFASWVAYVMFEDTIQGKTVFTSYGATLYQIFVLFTTSNNPDVWVPAYKASRWYCLYFVIYVLFGVYFVTNLVLAVVYDSFKSELVKQVFKMDRMRTAMLEKAFNLLDTHSTGYLNKEQCIRLFEELNKYRTLPKITKEEFELIFEELDDSHDVKLNKDEFADICHAIALKFHKEDTPSYFEYFPFYNSPASNKLKAFVKRSMFGYLVSFVLVLNLVAVIIETTLDIQNNSGQKVWQVVEFIFGWIYVIEMALKVYSYGFENYWRDGQNRFDFVITWIIVIGETITFASPDDQTFFSNGEWIRYLLLARMLRLIRLLMHVKQFRGFVATFLTLLPSLMPYFGIIFCVLCIYCSVGVQIFGGLVNAGNPKLITSDLADNDYLLFNFNDYPNGMVTLFNLLVMGNWQVWMQSYKELTGTSWAYLYFISFYLITVLLLLNLVVAFVLEAFFAEIELESSDTSDEQDKGYMAAQREEILITSSMSTDMLTDILGAIKDLADTVRCQSESNREFLDQIRSEHQNGEGSDTNAKKHLSTQTTIDCQSLRKTHHPLFMANMIQS